MAVIAHITNPFDPINSREIVLRDGGFPLYTYFNNIDNNYEIIASVNGHITEEYEAIVKQNDCIAFVAIPQGGGGGGGKNILRSVAMIALTVAASYATGGAAAAGGWFTAGSASAYALSAGIMIGGGMLVNTLMPQPTPDYSNPSFGDGYSNSSTYSWGVATNSVEEGTSIPIIYGTVRVTPPLISQYVETIDNKQYLNMLFALNDGTVTSITDIYINDNPITYYENVTSDIRLGTNTQTLIPSFDNTRVDTAVSAILSNSSWVTRQGSGNTTNEITVVISAPQGLYYANDAGGLNTVNVPLDIEYRAVGSSTWLEFATTPSIEAAQNNTVRVTYTKDTLTADQYEIRVQRTSAQSTSSRTSDKVYFEAFTEVVYDDFTYPNTALLSIRALATDQLSGGRPRVSCLVSANSDNPSLICQDILENWAGVETANIAATEFTEFETFCTTNDYTCNIVFDTSIDIEQALSTVSQLGRALVIRVGTTYMPIIDKVDALPTQGFLFTMGNIVENSFSKEYLPTIDRSNVIDITYFDDTLDYERQSLELYQVGFDESVSEIKKSSISLYGCTDRAMAIKHGRYLLNKAKYLTTTVSFNVALDAIACRIGDIILVSHDLPQWGFSGRIESVGYTGVYEVGVYETDVYDTGVLTTINLDKEITMLDNGTVYAIQVRLSDTDNIVSTNILVPSGGYTGKTLQVIDTFAVDPQKYDVYSFGEVDKITKEFRVLNISRNSDQIRKITAIEYIAEVYDDNADSIPVVNKSSLSTVTNLMGIPEYVTDINGVSNNVVNLSWSGNALDWNVFSRLQGESDWNIEGVATTPFFKVENVKAGNYDYRVGDKTVSVVVDALPTISSITTVTPVPKYTGVQFNITYTPFDDFSHIEVWEATLAQTINDASLIGTTDSTVYSRYGLPVTSSKNYWFRIADVYGNTSAYYGEVVGTTSTDITAIILAMKATQGTETYQPKLADILTAGTVGGVATLGVSGNLLVDGTVSANAITANTITASEIAANTITASEIAASTITSDEMSTNVLLVGGKIESSNYDWNSGTPIGFGMWATGETDSGESYNIVGSKIFGSQIDGSTLNISDINIKDTNDNTIASSFSGTVLVDWDSGTDIFSLTTNIKNGGTDAYRIISGGGYLSMSHTVDYSAFSPNTAGYMWLFACDDTNIPVTIKDGVTTRATGTILANGETTIAGIVFNRVFDNSYTNDYHIFIKEQTIPTSTFNTGLVIELNNSDGSFSYLTTNVTYNIANM